MTKITWQLCKSLIEKGKPLPKINLDNYDRKRTFFGFIFSYRDGGYNPNLDLLAEKLRISGTR